MRRVASIALATLLCGCGPDPELVKMQDARDRQAAEESAQKIAQEVAEQKRAAADTRWNAEQHYYVQHLATQSASLQRCTTSYVEKYRKSGLSASELIEAALSSCRNLTEAIREDSAAFTGTHFPPLERQKLNDEVLENAIQAARGLCFQTLAENK